ncbi:MAG: sigma-70 family RNA polymerase sigma factor [Sedimentisphaerales bacterium]|nr:sigma-70 family RNA polymerase sigma factor [Sedimentisphaerales bacterium]
MAERKNLDRIISGCRNGDAESFSQLIDMYAGRCYGYFYRATGNRTVSDDLLGELFVKLVEKIGSFKGGSFEGWLFKVVSNIFHDYLRAKYRQSQFLKTHKSRMQSQVSEPERCDGDEIDKLQLQLNQLDADTREVIMLRYYSQASFREIAQMRSELIGTTLSKVHRGLKKLRELMEG